ncbi:MAG: hypothetical protein RIF46_03315, partial [Cyclobacteriaceae bacterium]
DYSSNEVKEAMLQFMNVLSRYIKVERKEFEILLQDAVRDTLFFIMSPNVYIEIEMDRKGTETLTEKSAKNISKYLRIAKDEFSANLISQVGKDRDDIELDESILTDALIQNEISLLNQVVPLSLKKLEEGDDDDEFPAPDLDIDLEMDSDEVETEPDEDSEIEESTPEVEELEELPEEEATDNTIETETEEDESEDEPEGEPAAHEDDQISPNISADEIDLDEVEEESVSGVAADMNLDDENEEESEIAEAKPEIITNLDPDEEDEDDEDAILNSRFEDPMVGSIAEKHEADADSMLSAISLNHRYMFINELFDGEADLFAEAINRVDSSKSFDDSVEMLMQNYAKDFHWDMNSDEVKELLKIIFRRFR